MVLSKEERRERHNISSRKSRLKHHEEVKDHDKQRYINNGKRQLKYYYENSEEINERRMKSRLSRIEEAREHERKYRHNCMWLVDIFLYPYKCYICNKKYDKVCIDLHHINPAIKDFGISYSYHLANTQPLRVIEEVLKCLVVCKNCHALIENKKIKLGEIKNRLI